MTTSSDTVVEFDVALIERARRGDSKAFERLYRDHVGRVHGLCLRMTRNPDLAADCAQDAFIKAWKALPKFEARSSFSTWLHRIAVNTVLEKRRGSASAEIAVEDPNDYEEPQMVLDSPVEEEELEAAIASLPQGARDALVLCGVYGYEHSEAASMLGIAVGTCKAQLHRARGLLKDRLERGVQ
jgi:RNA polymerase sigma-70 factor (ECF subfamily)